MLEKVPVAAMGPSASTTLPAESQQIVVPPDCGDDDDLLGLRIIDKLLFQSPTGPKIHCGNDDNLRGLQIIDNIQARPPVAPRVLARN
jgi:hypothetical protein